MEPHEQHIVRLTKRVSSRDYWDGYIAGLKAAREALDRFIVTAEELRQIDATVTPDAHDQS